MGWIERDAVRYFGGLFDSTRMLEPEIPEGDKGKVTDGFVYIYSILPNAQSDHSLKNGFVGRLPVQVKGRLVSKTGIPPRSFSLKRHELENLAKVGGAVLLVAGLPRQGSDKPVPLYADLAPDNVRFALEQMKPKQKEKAIKLKRFPTEPDEILSLILHLQKRFSLNSVISPNDDSMRNADGLTVVTPEAVDYSRPQLFGGPGSSAIITVNYPDRESQVIDAILQVTPEAYGLVKIDDLVISCGDVEFDDIRRRRRSDGRVELYISPGISFVLTSTRDCTFHLRFQTRLYFVSKDVAFLQNLKEGCAVRFNGADTFTFGGNLADFDAHTSASPYLQDLNSLCTHFGIDSKLFPVADLPGASIEALRKLTLHLFHDGRMELESTVPMRHVVELHEQQLQLLWSDWDGSWNVLSFFDPSKMSIGAVLNDSESGNPELVTAYEFFNASELTSILNLNPGQIIEGYRGIGGERALELASGTVQKLLAAADRKPERRREFLDMADELNRWIVENDPGNVFVELNEMQIKYRFGTLDCADLEFIENTWRAARRMEFDEDSLVIELASSILLDRCDGASYLLGQMMPEERVEFEKSPIMYLCDLQGTYHVGEPGNASDWQRVEDEIEQEFKKQLALYRSGKPTMFGQN